MLNFSILSKTVTRLSPEIKGLKMKEAQTTGQQLKNLSSGRFLKISKIKTKASNDTRVIPSGISPN